MQLWHDCRRGGRHAGESRTAGAAGASKAASCCSWSGGRATRPPGMATRVAHWGPNSAARSSGFSCPPADALAACARAASACWICSGVAMASAACTSKRQLSAQQPKPAMLAGRSCQCIFRVCNYSTQICTKDEPQLNIRALCSEPFL